ncbi:MAG: ferredoxin--nitrite reductase [Synechococcales cyanobacterium RM1_1_8]|nr:ferredoxin--nitrite reductase [Synechococcales cyanobacterium RM1_1_8]
MKVGDRVRVKASVMVYHYPKKVHQAVDLQGMEGEIQNIATEYHGKPISANFPLHVKLDGDKPFFAHLREEELELID